MKISINLKILSISRLGILGFLVLLLIYFQTNLLIGKPVLIITLILVLAALFLMKKTYIVFQSQKKIAERIVKVLHLLSIDSKSYGSKFVLTSKVSFTMRIINLGIVNILQFQKLNIKNRKEAYIKTTILKYQRI